MIEQAAAALATATTAAEVLDAKNKAGFAYTTAKAAARFAEAKNAHDAIVAACHKAMGDALIIQAAAQCRLADEYDAAQERGEAQKPGGDRRSINIPKENNDPTVKDIGLTSKQVYEARAIRDAEKMRPGIVRETVEGRLKAGRGPTLADVKHAIAPAPAPAPAPAQPREAAPSPAKKTAATTPVQPDAKKIQRAFMTPDSDDWKEVVPSKDMNDLRAKYDDLIDKHNELVGEYNELLDERDELAAAYDSLKDVVEKHGLDWWEGMPALRITDSEKATEWFEHALAYYADWNRLRVDGPISDEEYERYSKEMTRVCDDFYAHYREEDSSESETPPVTPDPAPEPGGPSAGTFPVGGERA